MAPWLGNTSASRPRTCLHSGTALNGLKTLVMAQVHPENVSSTYFKALPGW